MRRLIDANVLSIFKFTAPVNDYAKGWNDAIDAIMDNVPTADAVPSEALYDFIREIGTITYGKERFQRLTRIKIFNEEIGARCGLWYDLKSCEWITTQKAIEECLKAVRELDDDVLYAGI